MVLILSEFFHESIQVCFIWAVPNQTQSDQVLTLDSWTETSNTWSWIQFQSMNVVTWLCFPTGCWTAQKDWVHVCEQDFVLVHVLWFQLYVGLLDSEDTRTTFLTLNHVLKCRCLTWATCFHLSEMNQCTGHWSNPLHYGAFTDHWDSMCASNQRPWKRVHSHMWNVQWDFRRTVSAPALTLN